MSFAVRRRVQYNNCISLFTLSAWTLIASSLACVQAACARASRLPCASLQRTNTDKTEVRLFYAWKTSLRFVYSIMFPCFLNGFLLPNGAVNRLAQIHEFLFIFGNRVFRMGLTAEIDADLVQRPVLLENSVSENSNSFGLSVFMIT